MLFLLIVVTLKLEYLTHILDSSFTNIYMYLKIDVMQINTVKPGSFLTQSVFKNPNCI